MGLGFDPGWAKTGAGGVALLDGGSLTSTGVQLIKTAPEKAKRFERMRVSMDDNRRLIEQYDAICLIIEKIKPAVIGVETYTIFESKEYEKLRDTAAKLMEDLGIGKGELPKLTGKDAAERLYQLLFGTLVASEVSQERAKVLLGRISTLAKAVDAFRVVRGRGAAAKTYGIYSAVQCAARRYNIPIYTFAPIDLKKAACGQFKASKDEVAQGLCKVIGGLREMVETRIRARLMHEHVYDASGHGWLALREYTSWLRDGMRVPTRQIELDHDAAED